MYARSGSIFIIGICHDAAAFELLRASASKAASGVVDSRAERECVSAFLLPGEHYNEKLCPGAVNEAGVLDLVPCWISGQFGFV